MVDTNDDNKLEKHPDQYQLELTAEFRFVDRWGVESLASGFTIAPNYLLRVNRYVGQSKKLSSSEIFVILTILSYWWDSHRLPFPSISRISQDTGISTRQIKRIIKNLEEK